MSRYEYMDMRIKSNTNIGPIRDRLNELGQEGWKLCSSSAVSTGEGPNVLCWLRRELPDAKPGPAGPVIKPGPREGIATMDSVCEREGHLIRQGHRARFADLVNAMNGLMAEVKTYRPDAQYFAEDGELHLMVDMNSDGPDEFGEYEPEDITLQWTVPDLYGGP